MTPTVAIVGRPNVGKSTLFNRLVGKKLALVDDRPGVTRDRREGEARLGDLDFRIIDTAGLEEADEGSLLGRMRAQTEAAIAEADVILFVIDARAGILPADRPFAELVRRSGKPVILVANKAEGGAGHGGRLRGLLARPRRAGAALGRARRGHGRPLRGADALLRPIPRRRRPQEDEERIEGKPLQVAIVGRPERRQVDADQPHDRRGAAADRPRGRHHPRFHLASTGTGAAAPIKLFDTAGLRKRARVEDKLEKLSVADALRAVRFAEVVVVLLDATIPFEKQDLSIADLVETRAARWSSASTNGTWSPTSRAC